MKILVPTTVYENIDAAMIPGDRDPADFEFVRYDPRQLIPAEHRDAKVLVSWTNTVEVLEDAAEKMTNLRFIQGLLAGTDAIEPMNFRPGTILAGGVGLHNLTVAEHTVALALAAARKLPQLLLSKQKHQWRSDLGGSRTEAELATFYTLLNANVTVLGYGSIARQLTVLLRAFGANIRGVARSRRTEGDVEVYPFDEVGSLLADTDLLISILPATAATEDFVNAELLAALPKHAWFINVGRGDVVNEDELITALKSGVIAGAALDVFKTEPLPADSEFWELDNVIITPHSAGGLPIGGGQRIADNLARLLDGVDAQDFAGYVKTY